MKIIQHTLILIMVLLPASLLAEKADWVAGRPDGCTSITVGNKASNGGWVSTSHTCDSHRSRAWFDKVAEKAHPDGSQKTMRKRENDDTKAMKVYKKTELGSIPQVDTTFGYINTAYPCMNEHQLAVGESTFGGRETLQSEKGLIDCQQLVELMLERCRTAREAIELSRDLLQKYGWNDAGECLTIADTREVWHLEIVGPGAGNMGAIWVAQRVPDEHVSVNANASRIRQVDLSNPDFFLASNNLTQVAMDSGWWHPADGPFEFCYAYDPEGRRSIAARRREWRVFQLLAPSLDIDPNDKDYPFSIKPDTLVTLDKLVQVFQDYYEGTDYNFVRTITQADSNGKQVISPFANPFMPYEMNELFGVTGGWGDLGERTIARWYTMYATITQSRDWLPDEIGGVVWMAMDNAATSIYTPIYCGNTDVAPAYKVPGRANGYNRDSAWWAFNRLSTLAAQRWGDMRHDVTAVWGPMQSDMFTNQAQIEAKALVEFKSNPQQAIANLTQYSNDWGTKVVQRAWKLGDELWTIYDEKW